MAKIAFTKLGLSKNQELKILIWNEQNIEIKQYLPIQEKFNLITEILNHCQDENNFNNEAKQQLYFDLEVVFKYTNINFTEKQREDIAKLYDLLKGSGLIDEIYKNIPEKELYELREWIRSTASHLYEYRNSAYGLLDAISTDYKSLDLNADELKNKIADPESLGLLKEVLTKLG